MHLGTFNWVIHQLNISNLICFILQLIYYLAYEIFKMSKSVRFYYGSIGTSHASRAANEAYSTHMQPIGLLKFYAALNFILLIWIFGNSIANCLLIYWWVKGTTFI